MPSRHRGSLLNRLAVPPGPETAAMLERVNKAVMPPKDYWPTPKPYSTPKDGDIPKSYKPPARTVTVTLPAGWVELADYLAKAQGMTRARFLSTLMNEQMYDIWMEARRQHRLSAAGKTP